MPQRSRLAIITGTTKGLGAALYAQAVSRAGKASDVADVVDVVVALSRDAAPKENTTKNIGYFQADFAQPDLSLKAIQQAFAWVATLNIRFDDAILFNNAGVAEPVMPAINLAVDAGAAALSNHFAVNVISPMLLSSAFSLATKNLAGKRTVVHISSGAAKRPMAGWAAYCASKAALEMTGGVAALEAATNDPSLAICSLAPGVIDTPMQERIRGLSADKFVDVARFQQMHETGQLRTAEAVATDIYSAFEQNLLVNGGLLDIRTLALAK
jgi:benzil reductase ((S)-benzoin forming)